MPRKKKRQPRGRLYISPDGGETIYEQLSNGKRGKLIEQSQLAKDTEIAQDEIEMHGVYAIQMRRQYPALKNAWEKYKTVWHLIHGEN